jgi:hypothetical protein
MTAHIEAALRAALRQRASSTVITESAYRTAEQRVPTPPRPRMRRVVLVAGAATVALIVALAWLPTRDDAPSRVEVNASTSFASSTTTASPQIPSSSPSGTRPLEKLSADPAWRDRLYQLPSFDGWFLSGNRRVALDAVDSDTSRLSVTEASGSVLWSRELRGTDRVASILRASDNSIIVLRTPAGRHVISEIRGDTGDERELVSYVGSIVGMPSRMNVVGDNVIYSYGGPTGTMVIVNFRSGQQHRIAFEGTLVLPNPVAPNESTDRRQIAVVFTRSQPQQTVYYVAVVDLETGSATEPTEFARHGTTTDAPRIRFGDVRIAWTTSNEFRIVWMLSDASRDPSAPLYYEAAATFDRTGERLTLQQIP